MTALMAIKWHTIGGHYHLIVAGRAHIPAAAPLSPSLAAESDSPCSIEETQLAGGP